MKHLFAYLLTFVMVLSISGTDLMAKDKGSRGKKGGPPGLQKKGGVPPGLQKKGGLPPGQAKKQGRYNRGYDHEDVEDHDHDEDHDRQERARTSREPDPVVRSPKDKAQTESTRTTTRTQRTVERSAPSTSTPRSTSEPEVAKKTTPRTPAAPPLTRVDPSKKVSKDIQRRRTKLAENVKELNQLGQKNSSSRTKILERITKSSRVPVSTLENQLRSNPGIGTGDLFVAHKIAKKSKQPVERILAQHQAGHSWGVLANEYRAGLGDLVDNTGDTRSAAKRAAKS